MDTGLKFIILGFLVFIASVATLYALVYILMKLNNSESDAELIEQIKKNPLQKKALGRNLRSWIPLLLIGGLVIVSSLLLMWFQ